MAGREPAGRVRIVHVLPSTDGAGAENQARYLLRGLVDDAALPAEVELVYFRPGRAHALFEATGANLRLVRARAPLLAEWPLRAARLRALYPDRPPDILHLWLYEAAVVGVAAALRWPATKVILAQRSGTMMAADRVRTLALRAIRPRVDHVLSNSEEGLALLTGVGYARDRMSITPNAVPPDRIVARRSRAEVRAGLGVGPDDPLLCTVGRADETKDLPGLMRAFAAIRDEQPAARLILVGPAPADLPRLAADPVPGALALGWMPDPASLMAASDLVLIPSWTEGHSNVADEALMLGLPVVSTDTGQHPALVAAAEGRVVPIRDPASLARASLELLRAPPDPAAVRAVAEQALSVAAAVASVQGVYRTLLGLAP
jgi:teichuronic acid biosynthesis glycosyltransferase TuaC